MNFTSKKLFILIISVVILLLGGVFWFTKSFNKPILSILRNSESLKIPDSRKNQAQVLIPSEPLTKPTKKLIFLMYHYVEVNQNKDDFKRDSLNTLPYIFEQQMLTLQKAGYKFIFPSEIGEFLNDTSNQKYVVVSFDDGYRTFYTYTYPIIKKHGIKSVNYIIYNFIGRENNMDAWMIEQLVKDGLVEVGSHTLNHPDITSISNEQLRSEIINSKDFLEKRFNTKVTSFCYPYGFYNEKSFPYLKEAGYLTATTTKEGSLISEDSLYEVKRIRPGILTGQNLLDFLDKTN
jgi:peptidoglycan/xylan/chitin deacetylase (PgdA/CDA1 family)